MSGEWESTRRAFDRARENERQVGPAVMMPRTERWANALPLVPSRNRLVGKLRTWTPDNPPMVSDPSGRLVRHVPYVPPPREFDRMGAAVIVGGSAWRLAVAGAVTAVLPFLLPVAFLWAAWSIAQHAGRERL